MLLHSWRSLHHIFHSYKVHVVFWYEQGGVSWFDKTCFLFGRRFFLGRFLIINVLKYILCQFLNLCFWEICTFYIMFTFTGMNLFAIYFIIFYVLYNMSCIPYLFPLLIILSFFIIGIGRILSIVWVILKHQLLALLNFSVICFYCYKFCSKQCFIYICKCFNVLYFLYH